MSSFASIEWKKEHIDNFVKKYLVNYNKNDGKSHKKYYYLDLNKVIPIWEESENQDIRAERYNKWGVSNFFISEPIDDSGELTSENVWKIEKLWDSYEITWVIQTPWSAPTQVFYKLIEDNPELSFEFNFNEEFDEYSFWIIKGKDWKVILDKFYNLDEFVNKIIEKTKEVLKDNYWDKLNLENDSEKAEKINEIFEKNREEIIKEIKEKLKSGYNDEKYNEMIQALDQYYELKLDTLIDNLLEDWSFL